MSGKEVQGKSGDSVCLELAIGEKLDKIGSNIYCLYRKYEESDHSYRARIIELRRQLFLMTND